MGEPQLLEFEPHSTNERGGPIEVRQAAVAAGLSGGSTKAEVIASVVFDCLSTPMLTLDEQGHVLLSNQAASRLFRHGELSTDGQGRIELGDENFSHFEEFLLDLGEGETAVLKNASGKWLGVVRSTRAWKSDRLFIVALADNSHLARQEKRLQEICPFLTNAECQICVLLLAAVPPKTVAEIRERSLCTVRCQISRILGKMNCSSIQELVAQLALLRLL